MRFRAPLGLTLVAAVVLGLGLGGAADGAAPGPVVPRLIAYEATLDVAGYVHVRVLHDDTGDCVPGRDLAIDYDATFELGRPRATQVTVFQGLATSRVASNRGGAIHRAELTSYRESTGCPPGEALGAPECLRRPGTLRAFLTPPPGTDPGADPGAVELAPLGHPVSIQLMRQGGGHQNEDCMGYMTGLQPSVGDHVVGVLEADGAGLNVPLGITDDRVAHLKKGASIRRTIRLTGACHHILVSNAAATRAAPRASAGSCTVTGKIFVALKRTG